MSRETDLLREDYEQALRLLRYFADYSKRTTQGSAAINAKKPNAQQRTFLAMRREARCLLDK